MRKMDAAPVSGVQGAKDRMVEYLDRTSKSLLRIRQRRIHGNQGVVELTQRLNP